MQIFARTRPRGAAVPRVRDALLIVSCSFTPFVSVRRIMLTDTTLCLVRPHAYARAAAIEEAIEAANFSVLAKMEVALTSAQATELYELKEGEASFDALVEHMASGPIVALALQKKGGVAGFLELAGPEDCAAAIAEAPNSLRAVFGSGSGSIANGVHASGSAAEAARELRLFFPKVFPRELATAVLLPEAAKSADAIVKDIQADGFLLLASRELTLTPQLAASIDVEGGEADGPVFAAVFEKAFANEALSALLGPADVDEAAELAPDSIRARYGRVHASGSARAASALASQIFGSELSVSSTTFAWVKPDAFEKADEIIAYAEAAGFTVVCSEVIAMSKAQAAEFYAEHEGKPFFDGLLSFMTSGPALALVLSRPCAVKAWRSLLGPTSTSVAQLEAPLSLRSLYGTDQTKNACHGSDSDASASRCVRAARGG